MLDGLFSCLLKLVGMSGVDSTRNCGPSHSGPWICGVVSPEASCLSTEQMMILGLFRVEGCAFVYLFLVVVRGRKAFKRRTGFQWAFTPLISP